MRYVRKLSCLSFKNSQNVFNVDEDECMFMMCDHICTNTVGSFRCTCNQGYELMENGMNCKGKIMFVEWRLIVFLFCKGSDLVLIYVYMLYICR